MVHHPSALNHLQRGGASHPAREEPLVVQGLSEGGRKIRRPKVGCLVLLTMSDLCRQCLAELVGQLS